MSTRRQVRNRRPPRRYRTYGPKDHSRHLRRTRRPRRRSLLGQGFVEGRPFGRICRTPHSQEHGGSRLADRGSGSGIVAIGIAEPLSIYVNTYGTNHTGITDGEIAERIGRLFDLRPASIVRQFGLKNPIFEATASYGHFGNRPYTKTVKLFRDGQEVEREIESSAGKSSTPSTHSRRNSDSNPENREAREPYNVWLPFFISKKKCGAACSSAPDIQIYESGYLPNSALTSLQTVSPL